jgi:hypothetical protein
VDGRHGIDDDMQVGETQVQIVMIMSVVGNALRLRKRVALGCSNGSQADVP